LIFVPILSLILLREFVKKRLGRFHIIRISNLENPTQILTRF
jgi:hypothetical protein